MDMIFLRELKVETTIGAYEWERHRIQTIELDLDIGMVSETACKSDDIQDTIHYGEVVETIRDNLKTQQFLLIEALAEHIASLIQDEFGTPWVRVAVTKLGILPQVKKVGVVIERGHKSS